ncbi:TetR/AcrR family transcriptional regulator [uncultured Massilia sp.]|uniref:TetR/AcrR family transcriptional regulator n=1 Tax=uncultured Massilia sp. TaxID=169973 RepID=UPI0025F76B5A|nr:TetR/AcrR family transcriptional regulator [uncultured Massilia sp.]
MTASSSEPARGAAPKRQRGHARVAAILQAAAALFLDKGYDAVTMTEIGAASSTAVGSLYRFFPSKEAVADALLRSYADGLADGLAALRGRAHGLAPAALGDALVDVMLELRAQRSVALALVDARRLEASRQQLRAAMLADLGSLLAVALPALPAARRAPMALALLHLLKGVGQVPPGAAMEAPLLDEYRRLVRAYLAAA